MSESEGRRRLSGAQIVVEYLVRQGVPIVAGIPGHGSWALTDALLDRQDAIRTVQVMHEQSAVHLADGFYRATGQPILAFTSIGPGATNTVVGMATAYVDSTAVALLTGSPHTYMRGAGLLQELERRHVADNPRIFEPVVKEWWQPSRVDELPFVLHRAWNQMVSGRPGPILLDVPMDVLADSAEVTLPDPAQREARGRVRPAADDIERAAALLRDAKRPVIVAGGGAITAEASAEVTALAERLGAPVVTTWNGKGAIDETHELAGLTIGDTASSSGNELAASADVILSVGNRFTDWSASSYRAGVTFSIPPTKLIQLDIDPREIGKNYPVEVGAGRRREGRPGRPARGARAGRRPVRVPRDTPYVREIAKRKAAWFEQVEIKSGSTAVPMTMARAVREVQAATRDDAIVVTGAGLPQGMVKQRWVTRAPRTHLTSGGFSTMGFELPAAIGAQLAQARPPGHLDLRRRQLPPVDAGAPDRGPGRHPGLRRRPRQLGLDQHQGRPGDVLRPLGVDRFPDAGRLALLPRLRRHRARLRPPRRAGRTTRPRSRRRSSRALASGGPSLVHVMVDRDLATAGPDKTGWWDAPSPEYHPEQRARWAAGVAEEQHR